MYVCVTKIRDNTIVGDCKRMDLYRPLQQIRNVPVIKVTGPSDEIFPSYECVQVRSRELERPTNLPNIVERKVIPYNSKRDKISPLKETSFLNFVPERPKEERQLQSRQTLATSPPEEGLELQVKLDILTRKHCVDIILPHQRRKRHSSVSSALKCEKPDLLKSLPESLDSESLPEITENEVYSPLPSYSPDTLDIFLMNDRSRSSSFSYFGELKNFVKKGKKNPKRKDVCKGYFLHILAVHVLSALYCKESFRCLCRN